MRVARQKDHEPNVAGGIETVLGAVRARPPSAWILNTTPGPQPLMSCVKIPIDEEPSSTWAGSQLPAVVLTTMSAPPEISCEKSGSVGTCTLMRFGDTYNRGAGIPLNVTDVPARLRGRVEPSAAAVAAARFSPLI